MGKTKAGRGSGTVPSKDQISNELIAQHGPYSVTVRDLLKELKYQTSLRFVDEAVHRLIVLKAIEEHGIDLDEDAVYDYMEQYREERDLYSEEEIDSWLKRNHLNDDEFYELCKYEASVTALREKLFPEEKLLEAFAYRKIELEEVELYHIIAPDVDLAKEIIAQAEEGEMFFEMARKYSTEEETKKLCGYIGRTKRSDLRAEIEAAVFSAKKGEIVGPFKGSRGYHLYLIDEIHPATFNERTKTLLRSELFAQFLMSKLGAHETVFQEPESE
jgi:parvulin-like peptidyl-prolyl isomerase